MNYHPFLRRAAKSLFYLLPLLLCFAIYGCGGDSGNSNNAHLVIAGVEQQAHVYQDGSKIVGLDVDISTLAASNAGV